MSAKPAKKRGRPRKNPEPVFEINEDLLEDYSIDLDALLGERRSKYGLFKDLSACSQHFKSVIYQELNKRDKRLPNDQIEAMDMFAHKIARIINGDNNEADHWDDIAGYASLVADNIRGNYK